ncbi:MAG: PKD domain-containing protein [Candidatus Krumholzibacteriota bacterium]
MKRACMLLVPVLMILAVVTGCSDDESLPTFTRVRVSPSCGVVPMDVEGYAILSGGNETGDPLGGNNNLEVKWAFGDGGTGNTSIAYHTYQAPGNYTVTVTGSDPDGQTTSATYPVTVLPDSLVIEAGSNFPDGACTCLDTVRFNIVAESCDIDYPTVLGDSVKLEFNWDMGDMGGVDNTTYNGVAPEFRFRTPGVYDVEVAVFYPAWAVERRQTLTFTVASAPPAIVTSHESIDFGVNTVGTPLQRNLAVTNTSCEDLVISAISIDNADFTTETVPVTLGSYEEISVDVTFNASTAGTRTGVLTVESNDPSRPVIEIPLMGEGVEVEP